MLTGTAVYGTVRTVVWEDGGETRLLPDWVIKGEKSNGKPLGGKKE